MAHKVAGEFIKAFLKQDPRIFIGEEHDYIVYFVDIDFLGIKPEFLRQSHRLTAAIDKYFRFIHTASLVYIIIYIMRIESQAVLVHFVVYNKAL